MAQPHLVKYVRDQIAAGYSPDEIRNYLVGHGYPVRDIDETIDEATRPQRKTSPFPTEKKVEQMIAKAEASKGIEEDFLGIFKNWFKALLMPMQVFPEEAERATLARAFMNILVASALGGFFVAMVWLIKTLTNKVILEGAGYAGTGVYGLVGPFAKSMMTQSITLVPIGALIVWLSITTFFYLFGIIAGGRGSFEKFAYFTSMFAAPLALLLVLMTLIPSKCVSFIAYVVFGTIGIYPMFFAVKTTHEGDRMGTLIGTFIPIVLIMVLMLPQLLKLPGIISGIC